MKGLKSRLGKAVDAAEGIGIGIGHGIGHGLAHVREKLRGESDSSGALSDFQKPPVLGEAPSFVSPNDHSTTSMGGLPVIRKRTPSLENSKATFGTPKKLDTVVSVFTEEVDEGAGPWWKKVQQLEKQFLNTIHAWQYGIMSTLGCHDDPPMHAG